MKPAAAPPVLFIAGVGRSGSTLLDRLLGAVPGVCAVGELRYIWELGFIEDQFCACGQRFSACPFWTRVVVEAFGSHAAVDAPAFQRRQEELVRLRNLTALFSRRPSDALTAFRRDMLALYRAIAHISGASLVVDSSKYPPYGIALRRAPGLQFATLHLVRDSRGSVHSITRTPGDPAIEGRSRPYRYHRSAASAATGWLTMNALAAFTRGRAAYRRIRYEDLCRDPETVIDEILRFARFEGARQPSGSWAEETREGSHALAGNPSRLAPGPVTVRADDAWKRDLGLRDRLVATAITAPLLLAYRYPLFDRSERG